MEGDGGGIFDRITIGFGQEGGTVNTGSVLRRGGSKHLTPA